MFTLHAHWVSSFWLATLVGCFSYTASSVVAEPIVIGHRRELFTDEFLIERLSGGARQVLQIPNPREVVFTADAPWEGNTSAYFTLFADGDGFRMYYRGSGFDLKTEQPLHDEETCLAVSNDGIRWTRPELGLFEFNDSTANNIVWSGTTATHNLAVFKDENPAAPPEARYKAIGGKGSRAAIKAPTACIGR